jgi:hypothetical protein
MTLGSSASPAAGTKSLTAAATASDPSLCVLAATGNPVPASGQSEMATDTECHAAPAERRVAVADPMLRIGRSAGEFSGGVVPRARRPFQEVFVVMVAQLDAYQPPVARWREWQLHEPILAGQDFAAVRRELMDRNVALERKDGILAALIRCDCRAGTDARLATIVCLLPGARRLAGRFGDILGWPDAMAELVASLWIQLGRFDIDRRADRIASRLLSASAHRLASLARRERAWHEHTSRDHDIDTLCRPGPTLEATGMASAVHASVLGTLDATLIEATRLNGLSLVDAAKLLGVSYEAAKKRRRRAEPAWVAWWASGRHPVDTGVERLAA